MRGESEPSGIDRRQATKNLVMHGVAARALVTSTLVTASSVARGGCASEASGCCDRNRWDGRRTCADAGS
jgi:hypothetical protein